MNTYAKFCPNVFVAKCSEEHAKGDIIMVATKYENENDYSVKEFATAIVDGKDIKADT